MEFLLSHVDSSLQSSLIASVVLAFFGGFLASLTPCVYPMIPITAGVIGHANIGGSRWRGFGLSLTYVVGMALTYAGLGLFAAASGRFFGAINSSPWTSLLVGNVLVLFALDMLEVIRLPLFAVRLGEGQGAGLSGIFLAGMSSALVAGPCTTPVLGSLLAYTASTRSLAAGWLLLFSFSLGMGALLLGVGTFSSFLASIPRSGAWMLNVKKGMGLFMLGMAEYFFVKAGRLFF